MQKIVEHAKGILKKKRQIRELQEAQRRKGKEHLGVNLIEAPYNSCGGQDHYTNQYPKITSVVDSEGWVEPPKSISYFANQGNNKRPPYQ